MLTDVVALDRIVRDRIHSRIAEAQNDRLADQLPRRRTAVTSGLNLAPIAQLAGAVTAVRLSAAHALRGLAAEIDPCAPADAGFLIARSR